MDDLASVTICNKWHYEEWLADSLFEIWSLQRGIVLTWRKGGIRLLLSGEDCDENDAKK